MLRQNKFKNCISVCFSITALFFLSGCKPREAKQSNGSQTIPVVVTTVKLQDISEIINYAGDIKAQDEVKIYPKVTGKIIEKVKEQGDSVSKGEPIAYIDRDEVGLKFERAPVESTLNGFVGRVFVDVGANVNPQTPIALVVSMDAVKVYLDVPEMYLPFIVLAQEAAVSVDTWPAQKFSGKVTKISPVIDMATRTAPIEILIDNKDHRLMSGMFANVELVLETHKNVPAILREAIMGKNHDVYVFVVENQKAALKKVGLGLRQGPLYEVKEGLKEGDRVVVMGQQRLYEGASVSTQEYK